MTKPGRRITVAKSVITGIRIDHDTLIVEGVDQDKDGGTLRSHSLTFTRDGDNKAPAGVQHAIDELVSFAQSKLDGA